MPPGSPQPSIARSGDVRDRNALRGNLGRLRGSYFRPLRISLRYAFNQGVLASIAVGRPGSRIRSAPGLTTVSVLLQEKAAWIGLERPRGALGHMFCTFFAESAKGAHQRFGSSTSRRLRHHRFFRRG
jgi:hypothetical protein